MVLELILPIIAELVTDPIKNCIISPVTRHASYAFKCSSKVQTLKDEVVQLKNKKDRLQQSVSEATRNGQEIYPNVTEWLSNVDRAIEEAEALMQRKEEANNKCFLGLCPDLRTRYRISTNAVKKSAEIRKLHNEDGLDSIAFRPPLQQIIEPSIYSRESLPSRVSLLNQIMDSLRDLNVGVIGIYGMGGVGKTTLAKEVQSKAVLEKLFDTVVVVAVSQTPELRRIQGGIADFLGLKFDAEEIPGRASQLYKRLESSRVLIILDDLWQKLDLSVVGIPSRGASKVMLTSRSRDLLSNEMGAEKLFSLEALDYEETLSLFQVSVVEAKDPKFHCVATEIAKKCSGLPLLIQIVATELKNKESHVWNNALNQLSTFEDEEIYEKVYKVLESSYENLPGKEMKSFFLMCALSGQSNVRIEQLLTYSMGLGLFKYTRTVENARDKVLTMIAKLKAKSLLLDGDMMGYVKMHDVVRDTALNIASRLQNAFTGTREVKLRDWPSKDCTRISLPFCGVSELPQHMDCPEAELFLIFTEDLCLEVPDPFFNGNKKLKVADFTGLRMVSLPSSIGLLTSLRALCLHKCRLDNVAVLGELKQLELLSFAGSKIVELPREIEALTRLQLLNLHDCSNLQVIPAGVLSKLYSLEELYMLNSFDRWDSEGNASLTELESLLHLLTLEIDIRDATIIPKGFKCFSRLRRYKISIGHAWDWDGQYGRSKTLKLKVEAGVDLEDGIELLLRESEDLYLDGARGIQRINYEGFPKLKHMHVENDSDIQHLIKPTMRASCNVFPVLESLYLNKLHILENICGGQLGMGSFGELQILKISNCGKLSCLFLFSSLKCLHQLRELEVADCENMEVVIGDGIEDHGEVTQLTQLNSLTLSNLPRLVGLCKLKQGSEQMGLLFNRTVSFPNLTSLSVKECKSLKHIFTVSVVKGLMQLKSLTVAECELVEEIIKSKKMAEIAAESEAIVFSNLDYLSLGSLGNVKRFNAQYVVEFPSLRELYIEHCGAMGNFVGKDSSSNSTEDYLFNELVSFSNLETIKILGLNNIQYLWDEQFAVSDSFFKLKTVTIVHCKKLLAIFPSKICPRFRRVEALYVDSCDRVEEIYQPIDSKDLNDPFSLQKLYISCLPSLKHIWNVESKRAGAFPVFRNLRTVQVATCEELKCVFPACVGCGLLQLQRLRLNNCNQLELLIAKGEDGVNASFEFPRLTELQLTGLNIPDCSSIYAEKFLSTVEELKINDQGFHAIERCADFSVECCSKLKKVTLCSLNEETSVATIFDFLSGLKSLETLAFEFYYSEDVSISDVSPNRRLIGDECHYRLRVKHLDLIFVEKKELITKKDSLFNHIFQHLQTLNMYGCYGVISIAQSSTSLRNLTTLHVYFCGNLKNLVTASTAKTMVHLIEMNVVDCRKIEEIVAKDGDSSENDVMIIFNKLQRLELRKLPNFSSFCSNKNAFSFPLLEQVSVQQCPRMNIFCGGEICTPELRGMMFDDEQQWEGNLNATIKSQLRKQVGEHLEDGTFLSQPDALHYLDTM